MKRLIVNADDFGLTAGVNRAIIDSYRMGVVTSTTLLVTGPSVIDAASRANENPGLGVGLHLNLTGGEPVLPPEKVSSLVGRDGRFPGLGKALLRITAGLARASEIEAEIAAQIGRCRQLGIEPTHVDSHHHLHAHPRLRGALTRVCRRMGIAKARGYRAGVRSVKSFVIRLGAMVPAAGEALRTPERFSGIEAMGRKSMAVDLRRSLAATHGTLEFMCHPGYVDPELAQASTYSSPRQIEFEALTSGEFLRAAEDAGAVLISFRDL